MTTVIASAPERLALRTGDPVPPTFRRWLFQTLYRRVAIRGRVTLGRDVHVGVGSRLWAPNGLDVADDVYIGKFCTVECDGSIGRGTMIANNVGLVGRFDHDFRARGVPVRHAPWVGDPAFDGPGAGARLVVGQDVWIGYGSVVLSGITIGRGAVVAAGSVVTKDVAPYAIVGGNPARPLGVRFSDDEARLHEAEMARWALAHARASARRRTVQA